MQVAVFCINFVICNDIKVKSQLAYISELTKVRVGLYVCWQVFHADSKRETFNYFTFSLKIGSFR